jgi:hypothetical protein
MDPTSKMFIEKASIPLNAFEIRQEWFYHEGRDLTFVIGKERKKCDWHSSTGNLLWTLHLGLNRLEVRTLNSFGVPGPVSAIEIGP